MKNASVTASLTIFCAYFGHLMQLDSADFAAATAVPQLRVPALFSY